jgi:hypothetical protein
LPFSLRQITTFLLDFKIIEYHLILLSRSRRVSFVI